MAGALSSSASAKCCCRVAAERSPCLQRGRLIKLVDVRVTGLRFEAQFVMYLQDQIHILLPCRMMAIDRELGGSLMSAWGSAGSKHGGEDEAHA